MNTTKGKVGCGIMKFKKGSFYIRLDARHNYRLEEVTGWISEDNHFGFHKQAGGWNVTDLKTGLALGWDKSRKKVADNIYCDMSRIEKVMSSPSYAEHLELFAADKKAMEEKNG